MADNFSGLVINSQIQRKRTVKNITSRFIIIKFLKTNKKILKAVGVGGGQGQERTY